MVVINTRFVSPDRQPPVLQIMLINAGLVSPRGQTPAMRAEESGVMNIRLVFPGQQPPALQTGVINGRLVSPGRQPPIQIGEIVVINGGLNQPVGLLFRDKRFLISKVHPIKLFYHPSLLRFLVDIDSGSIIRNQILHGN
jgi:hypothetical protein